MSLTLEDLEARVTLLEASQLEVGNNLTVSLTRQQSDYEAKIAAANTQSQADRAALESEIVALKQALQAETGSREQQFHEAAPVGTIVAFGGTAIPAGWLLCDGAIYGTNRYPKLFEAIGTAWGNGEGNGFNLPDLRGRFLRGVDAGTRDPDHAGRTACNPGGNTGRTVYTIGSVQGHQIFKHSHGVNDPGHNHPMQRQRDPGNGPPNAGNFAGYNENGSTEKGATNITIQEAGGEETRPINAFVLFIIKAA